MKFEGVCYDVTSLAEVHPGGKSIFLMFDKEDATSAFYSKKHTDNAREKMKNLQIISKE